MSNTGSIPNSVMTPMGAADDGRDYYELIDGTRVYFDASTITSATRWSQYNGLQSTIRSIRANFKNATVANYAFNGCSNIEHIDVKFPKANNFRAICQQCYKLTHCKIENSTFANDWEYAFYQCTALGRVPSIDFTRIGLLTATLCETIIKKANIDAMAATDTNAFFGEGLIEDLTLNAPVCKWFTNLLRGCKNVNTVCVNVANQEGLNSLLENFATNIKSNSLGVSVPSEVSKTLTITTKNTSGAIVDLTTDSTYVQNIKNAGWIVTFNGTEI